MNPRLPAINGNLIAFVLADDLWIADRSSGDVRRLTNGECITHAPKFSPDGCHIAFSSTKTGTADVYVHCIRNGLTHRLTWHPSESIVCGWNPSSQSLIFASPRRQANSRTNNLYSIPISGGEEKMIFEAHAFEGCWSPDGSSIAYRPWRIANRNDAGWRLHRGGGVTPIWVLNIEKQEWHELPHENAADYSPVWIGDRIYFLSDRDGQAANIFAYSTTNKKINQVTFERDNDVRCFDIASDTIVYEAGGKLHLTNHLGEAGSNLELKLPALQNRPDYLRIDASTSIGRIVPSDTGDAVLVEARGRIFMWSHSAESYQGLATYDGARTKDALWSTDESMIAYLSDITRGRHQIVLRHLTDQSERQLLLPPDLYFKLIAWSPDGTRIALSDHELRLYVLEISPQELTLRQIATTPRRRDFDADFSACGRYLAYVVRGPNYLSEIHIYDFKAQEIFPLLDYSAQLVHTDTPAFSKASPSLLYFCAATDAGLTSVDFEMSSLTGERNVRIYSRNLAQDGLIKSHAQHHQITRVSDARGAIVDLNVDANDGLWWLQHLSESASSTATKRNLSLLTQPAKSRFSQMVSESVVAVSLSTKGRNVAFITKDAKRWMCKPATTLDPTPVEIVLGELLLTVSTTAEWRQIFDEAWWTQKIYFYDRGLHGINWNAIYEKYASRVEGLQTRTDLDLLLVEMIAEMRVGHNRVISPKHASTGASSVAGLLGADFSFVGANLRVDKIYRGDIWSEDNIGPLANTQVEEGDFIHTINGQQIAPSDNLFEALAGTAGLKVSLEISKNRPDGTRIACTVRAIRDESDLRRWEWISRRLDFVESASQGRVAYVALPDTMRGGYEQFNRMFFPQSQKEALILDARCNNGGQAADYLLSLLVRPHLASWQERVGLLYHTPGAAIHGPKILLIDQDAGSGGDFLAYAFRKLKLGTIVGTRTWGALIGVGDNPEFVDGGSITVPSFRFISSDGEWAIENQGVEPDLVVRADPLLLNIGRDGQLETAVRLALEQMKTANRIRATDPPPPYFHRPKCF